MRVPAAQVYKGLTSISITRQFEEVNKLEGEKDKVVTLKMSISSDEGNAAIGHRSADLAVKFLRPITPPAPEVVPNQVCLPLIKNTEGQYYPSHQITAKFIPVDPMQATRFKNGMIEPL